MEKASENRSNILVVYYSRTGTTTKVAEAIREALDCEIDEIEDTKGRGGIIGWLRAGRDAGSESFTKISGVSKDPSEYDIVVIGSPTWNGHVSTPIRTYITEKLDSLNDVALFSTGDVSEPVAITEMEELARKSPLATLHLVRKRDVEEGIFTERVGEFASRIRERAAAGS
ncbi:MAG: flavodoxin domain-containing protein [Candidatus Bathyarchaeota archaeon]|nr:flavodoxin domain-containing protein [Candidatus Bathyarchaeota archaeon]